MHIDQDKLIDLISDASGISRENVEKQVRELVEEISQALEDGEAYEINDFGVFSAMGNNLIFIPADNLETEINYKYVGMEAIEVEDTAAKEEEEVPEEDERDPFAGLLGDDLDDEEAEEDVFEEFIAEDDEVIEETEKEEPVAEEAIADDDDILNIGEDADELIPEDAPGPEKWGIDTYKDDSAEGVFSGMMRDADQEEVEEEYKSEAEVISSGSASDDDYAEESLLGGEENFDEDFEDPFAELAKNARSKFEEESPGTTGEALEEEGEDDEADVFAGLADLENLDDDENNDEEPEETAAAASERPEDYVPVVANVSSDLKPEKEKKKEKEPEKKSEKKEYKPASRTKKSAKQGNPSLLLVVIVILIGAGVTYGLAYFGVVNIEGITPQNRQVQLTQQNNITLPPAVNEEQSEDAAPTETGNGEIPAQEEQPVTTDNEADMAASETELPSVAEVDQDRFGLMGRAVAEANTGFTIVLYTLTNQDNAEREYQRLSSIGFRTLMQQRQNSSYGTVYRLSIGQFSTLTDAAIAAEDLGDGIPDNYIISRIN